MKQIITYTLCFLFCFTSLADLNGQLKTVDDVIKDIKFQSDTIKSVFDWVTLNIAYDVNKAELIRKDKLEKKVKPPLETRIAQLLANKKGVCEDYSLLFKEVLLELGYNVYQVSGYSRSLVTDEISMVGHAWNVLEIDGKWTFYDPTWGAGFVKNKKFTRRYNPDWYDVNVETMSNTHMPYDPIWQLRERPLNYSGFDKSNESDVGASIDYESLIKEYQTSSKKKRTVNELARIQSLSGTNEVIDRRIKFLKKQKTNFQRNSDADIFNSAIRKMKKAYANNQEIRNAAKLLFKDEPWDNEVYVNKYFEETSLLVLEAKSEMESLSHVKDEKRIADLKRNINLCDDYLNLLHVYKERYESIK